MSTSFAQQYLIELLGGKLLLEPQQAAELTRGIEMALATEGSENAEGGIPLDKLVVALEKIGLPDETAMVNILETPLTPLWVRASLQTARRKLTGRPVATVVIVGLWQTLRGKSGRRTQYVEQRFNYWRQFIESYISTIRSENTTITWLG